MRVKRSKFIIFGLIIFFLCYFTLNYVNIKNRPTLNDLKEQLLIEKNNKAESNKINVEYRNSETKRYFAHDGGGFGTINSGLTKCPRDNVEVEVLNSNGIKNADISYFNMNVPGKLTEYNQKRHYVMVYGLESEVHSYGGQTWNLADFRMYYNLDKSFPEPATYFDVKYHLADLLSPPKVDFDKKTDDAPITWVVSNCNAYNGRELFMKEFMEKIKIDSYGGCLKNKYNHPSEHMKGNIELFAKYKFVIAIENSNCEDYVTEKLVHAVASGSIPIVAGKDNKPNYDKFLPKNSYINIYDYNTVDELVAHIKSVASNRVEYEKHMKFRFKHSYSRDQLIAMKLPDLIETSKHIIGSDELFFKELVAKEKSENKLCKIASYLNRYSKEEIERQIEKNRMSRPDSATVCLKSKNLFFDFTNKNNNN